MEGERGSWWGNAKQWVQKQYFNVAHNIDLGLNNDKSSKVTIFGNTFDSNQQAKIIYSSILWFTYREQLTFRGSSITSDVGWGCMLRVGQMAMAEALRRTEGIEKYGDADTVNKIIRMFIGKNGLFSVQRMVEMGEKMFKKAAGEWFTPSETAHILKQLQNNNQNSPLRILVYNNEFQITSAIEYLNCNNRDKKKQITQSYIKRNKYKILQNCEKISIFPGLIIILVRIGMNSPQPEMLQAVVRLMKFRSFMGILGGKPGLARYLVGYTDNSFVYLDPHCVKNNQQTEDFLNQSMFSMPQDKVDTSMGLCFYVQDYAQLLRLYYDDLKLLDNKAFYSHSIVQPPRLLEIIPPDHYEVLGPNELKDDNQ